MNRGQWTEYRMELAEGSRSGAEFVFVGEGSKPVLELTPEQWRALAPEGITPPVSLSLRLEGLWPSALELRAAGAPTPTELADVWQEGREAASGLDRGENAVNPYEVQS